MSWGAGHEAERGGRVSGSASGRRCENHPDASETSAGEERGRSASRPDQPLTVLIQRAADGDSGAAERLWQMVYDHLRAIAVRQLARESDGRLEPTTLVHEAYLRLIGTQRFDFENRRHFFGAATRAMRQILVDESRRRKSLKRGGGREPLSYEQTGAACVCAGDAHTPPSGPDAIDLIALNEALDRLEAYCPRLVEIVHLRFFGGLSIAETAELLDVSPRTVASDWAFARAWLSRELATQSGTRD